VRGGVNSTIHLDKCHFSEARNNAIFIVNPRALKISNSNISKPLNGGIVCEWLSKSDWNEKGRKVNIENNEFYGCGKEGISIVSQVRFSAHNVKIYISNNKVSRGKGDGIYMNNLAISDLEISKNECSYNSFNGLNLREIH
jgi:hypothetical protein